MVFVNSIIKISWMQSLPGWKTNIDEVSNGVFKVTLADASGRICEIIDIGANETIDKAMDGAFDIEKQTSPNWSKFLFDICYQKLSDAVGIIDSEYNEKAFGSWYVQMQNTRIVYDGRDAWLVFQIKHEAGWKDKKTIVKNELTYQNFIALICP